MSSNYSSDPRVPPAKVGHLGKHHRATDHGPVGLPSTRPPAAPPRATAGDVADPGPSYADFLEDETNGELPGQTG